MGQVEDSQHPVLKWLDGSHLRSQELRVIVERYYDLAVDLDAALPASAEKTVAMRKLVESKDAAVRAAIEAGVG